MTKGRRIFWGWVREGRKGASSKGWGSVATLPRILSLHDDASLKIEPAPELESLRMNARKHENLSITVDNQVFLADVRGDSSNCVCLLSLAMPRSLALPCAVHLMVKNRPRSSCRSPSIIANRARQVRRGRELQERHRTSRSLIAESWRTGTCSCLSRS